MEYFVLNKKQEDTLNEIKRRIRRLQNGRTIDSLISIGANTDNQIGASYTSLKKLAESYVQDAVIATSLWAERKREEQIFACFLFPDNFEIQKVLKICKNCLNYEVAEYFGSLFVYRHKDICEIIDILFKSEDDTDKIIAITAIARHILIYKHNSKITKEEFLHLVADKFANKYVEMIAQRYR